MADATAPIDIHKALHSVLPIEAVLENGDRIPLTWHDAEEGDVSGVTYPFGTFNIRGETMLDRTSRHYGFDTGAATNQSQTDNFTVDPEVEFYLASARDIVSVTSATGDKGSGPEALVLDTDYEIVANDDYDFMPNSFRLLTTLVDASTFSVTYDHRLTSDVRQMHAIIPCRLVIRCKDLANGVNGATKNYAKSHLNAQIAEYVLAYLRLNQGKGLVNEGGQLRLGRAAAAGFNDFDQSDSERQTFIEVFLNKRYKIRGDDFEFIRDSDKSLTFS